MKLLRFLWLIPVIAFSLWLVLPWRTGEVPTDQGLTGAPTPIPGIPLGAEEVLNTHFPGVIFGVIVIIIIIIAGILIKPKNS